MYKKTTQGWTKTLATFSQLTQGWIKNNALEYTFQKIHRESKHSTTSSLIVGAYPKCEFSLGDFISATETLGDKLKFDQNMRTLIYTDTTQVVRGSVLIIAGMI